MPSLCAFAHGLPLLFPPRQSVPPRRPRPTCTLPPPSSLSNPLPPPPDAFSILPALTFIDHSLPPSARPDLLGTVLWSVGLYLGISERVRWGAALRTALSSALRGAGAPVPTADAAATALHTLPFLFAGIAVDAALRAVSAGAWADAAGVSLAMYGGIYEAGRSSQSSKKVGEAEEAAFSAFQDFATRRLQRRGRCHLMDVRSALVQDSRLRRVSDEQLRRFIRTYAPSARRTPNGYYRELSVLPRNEQRHDERDGF